MRLTCSALALVVAGAVAATVAASPLSPSPARVYAATLAFAMCMRAHGVPHPDPDRAGDFRLTPADELRLRRVGKAKREAAEQACFHYLKGFVSTKPLSAYAKAQAADVLAEVRSCVRGYGFTLGKPVVENMSLGRAFFGFDGVPSIGAAGRQQLARAERVCEKRLRLAARLDAIVAADRGPY